MRQMTNKMMSFGSRFRRISILLSGANDFWHCFCGGNITKLSLLQRKEHKSQGSQSSITQQKQQQQDEHEQATGSLLLPTEAKQC